MMNIREEKKGKYFVAVSKLNYLVLDVKDSCTRPGTAVFMQQRKISQNNNQLWFEDIVTGTMRSKLNETLCLDINAQNYLVVDTYDPRNTSQRWHKGGTRRDRLEHSLETERFLEVDGNRLRAPVKVTSFKQSDAQKWNFEHVDPEYFHIVNDQTAKALDIKGWNKKPGAPVVCSKFNGCLSQQWYHDIRGSIRSRLNDFDLSVPEIANGGMMELQPHRDGLNFKNQLWTRAGDKIVNMFNPHLVVEAAKGDDQQVSVAQYREASIQHWQFKDVYEKYNKKT